MSEDRGQYVCAMCGGTFDHGWTEEEAVAERESNFPGLAPEAADIVCDDCFNKLPIADWRDRWREETA